MDYTLRINKGFGVFFGLIFLLMGPTYAQDGRLGGRPKVGVVLSGGGAKGLAHIGALKVIEEAGIEIDYIGGTSMGAIVGALYASGYSAQQLDSIFYALDFTELIQDEVPRGAKTFYEKDDDERYALGLPFDGFKVSFPQAFSGGQNIYNELVRLLFHVKDVQNFNKLPIPFLCIATDVETGEGILLDHGYLPEAITASGTFPSLFEPMEIDGRVLIDGGVVNNFPVDEVRALGADIIIGVDVQHGLANREDLNSATEILLQINNYRTVRVMEEKREKVDLYIHPEMEAYSVIDFELGPEIIQVGEAEARKKLPELQELSAQLQQQGHHNKTLTYNTKARQAGKYKETDSLVINRLRIFGTENYSRGYIKGKLRFDLAEPITFEKLKQGLNNLAASGNFKGTRYLLRSNGLGTDLILKLKEDPTKTYLKMGAHYDDLFKSSALINLTRKNFLSKDDVASFDLIVGDNVRYSLQYYRDKGPYWSFGFNSSLNDFERSVDFGIIQSNFNVIQDPNIGEINLDVTEWKNQIYLQTVFREEFALQIGAEHKLLKYSTRTLRDLEGVEPEEGLDPTGGNNQTFFENSNFYSAYGGLVLDTYDDRYFPTKGLYFNGDFHLYLFSSDFNENFKEFSVSQAQMGAVFPLTDKLSWQLETEGGFKLGRQSRVTSFDFVLGGFGNEPVNNFKPFLGYDFLSLPGNSYVKAYTRFDYRFSPKNHLLLMANIANVEDDLFRTGEWFSAPDYSGYALGWGYESFLGPVQVLWSWSPETTQSQVFFSVGFWF